MNNYIYPCEFKLTWNAHLLKGSLAAGDFVGHHGGKDFRVLGHHLDGLLGLFFCDSCINSYIVVKVAAYNKIKNEAFCVRLCPLDY